MTIAPISKSVTVKATIERAFEIFTNHTSSWWKEGQSSGNPWFRHFTFEPVTGGKWMETKADGSEFQWGKVLDWQPEKRILLAWQLNTAFELDPDLITEVEITFEPVSNTETRVTLEHRNLERLGQGAEQYVSQLGQGWPRHLTSFAVYVNTLN